VNTRSFEVFVIALCALPIAAPGAEDALPPAVVEAEEARIATMNRAAAATIAIFQAGGQGGGSGVIISPDGYALSNFHVTEMGPALECGLPDGSVWPAVIVGVDPTGDVALIKLIQKDDEPQDFPHAPLGDSDSVRTGEWVFAAGNPFLLADNFQPSISFGLVSGTHRYQYPAGTLLEYADCIQTDAAINPGNSGGPLYNMQGDVIGINGRGSFEKRGRVNVGVGYAISINQIKRFIGYLKSGRIVDHATLGATVTTDENGRVVVDDILETSDAFRRGLRYDDEIVRLGERDITTVNGFKNVLGTYPKGWRIPLVYRRDGTSYEVHVRLEGAHREGELAERISGRPPQMPDEPRDPRRPRQPGEPEAPPPPQFPIPGPGGEKQELPADVAALYEERRGFANYYFNKQHLAEIFEGFATVDGDASGVWTITGRVVTGGPFTATLAEQSGQIRLPTGQFEAAFGATGELSENLSPPGSGGLLPALHLWQRLLTVSKDRFGEIVYRGTMPLAANEPWMQVVDATYGGIEMQLYFAPDSKQLVGLEMFADPHWDPCELYFDDYRTIDGQTLPYRIEVHHGGNVFTVLEVDMYDLDAESGDAAAGGAPPDEDQTDPAENSPETDNG
jgi:S1-C subfamily serine protease